MEIKFEAAKAEVIELAKMAYVAQYVFDSSGQFSTGYHYLYMKEFHAALRLFNKMLVQYISDTGLVQVNEESKKVFTHTIRMEEECQKVLTEFQKACFLETLCDTLAERDYDELYGAGEGKVGSKFNSEAYHILHDNNMRELKKHGLKRLRIEE